MTMNRESGISTIVIAFIVFVASIGILRKSIQNQQSVDVLKNDAVEWTDENRAAQVVAALPDPVWIKGVDGRMKWVNENYCKEFDCERTKYLGKTDYDIWPAEVADRFRFNDNRVLTTKQPYLSIENLGEEGDWYVEKFPIFGADSQVIGIGGRCWPVESSE